MRSFPAPRSHLRRRAGRHARSLRAGRRTTTTISKGQTLMTSDETTYTDEEQELRTFTRRLFGAAEPTDDNEGEQQ